MIIKFRTCYDFLQAILGIVLSTTLLFMKLSFSTVIIVIALLFFAFFKSFGRRIIFYDNYLIARFFLKKTKLKYDELKNVKFVTHIYGKPLVVIRSKNKTYKGYVKYSDWNDLKIWLELKGTSCTEIR